MLSNEMLLSGLKAGILLLRGAERLFFNFFFFSLKKETVNYANDF